MGLIQLKDARVAEPVIIEMKDLHVSAHDKPILKGLNLIIRPGEVHALMGPNGSGKSTLSNAIAGHPGYKIEKGDILVNGKSIIGLSPDERARAGLFLAFQHPVEIPGVTFNTLLFTQYKNALPGASLAEFQNALAKSLESVGLTTEFVGRAVNAGLSGGEKKRAEILQMLITRPAFAILDEIDSGLDIDSLKTIARAVNQLRSPSFGALVITHYNRILEHLRPDFVHVLIDGKIVVSGGQELSQTLEQKGYAWLESREAKAHG